MVYEKHTRNSNSKYDDFVKNYFKGYSMTLLHRVLKFIYIRKRYSEREIDVQECQLRLFLGYKQSKFASDKAEHSIFQYKVDINVYKSQSINFVLKI